MLEAEENLSQTNSSLSYNKNISDYSRFFDEEFDNLLYDAKLNYRLFRKKIKKFINKKLDKTFTNVIYLTAECPMYMPNAERFDSPVNYVYEMRKQFPETNICILLPLIGLNKDSKISKKLTVDFNDNFFDLEKTSIDFDLFAQNKTHECTLYKFNKNEMNVSVYGIFSPAFSYLKNTEEIKSFDKIVVFLKAARTVIKNLYKENFKPDIVHSEFLPFYLGAEFEQKFPSDIKVIQIFDNFVKMEEQKQEAFWSIINIADRKTMKKICKDSAIKNYIARLFNIPAKNINRKIDYYINIICDNYTLFNQNRTDDNENKENFIFEKLNNRIKKLYPNILQKDEKYYYPFMGTISACDYWAVYSQTYYKELYEKTLASNITIKELIKTANKSGFVEPIFNTNVFNS